MPVARREETVASLYRRGNTWWAKYQYRGTVVRESLGTRSSTEARRRKSALEHDLDRGLHLAPSRTPVKEFLEECPAFLRSARTAKSYKDDLSYLRLCFGPIIPEHQPHDSRGRPMPGESWLRKRPVPPLVAASSREDIQAHRVLRVGARGTAIHPHGALWHICRRIPLQRKRFDHTRKAVDGPLFQRNLLHSGGQIGVVI